MKNLLALDKKITKHIMRNIWCKKTDDCHRVSSESVQATKDRRRLVHYRIDCKEGLGRREKPRVGKMANQK